MTTSIRYDSHSLTSDDATHYFVVVGSLVHVSCWRGHDVDDVRAMPPAAARREWRRLVRAGFVRGPSDKVSAIFHGLVRRHVPSSAVADAYAECRASADYREAHIQLELPTTSSDRR